MTGIETINTGQRQILQSHGTLVQKKCRGFYLDSGGINTLACKLKLHMPANAYTKNV